TLHDDEMPAVVDPGVVDLHDVGVNQLGHGQRLAPEAGNEPVVVGEMLGQYLDRDRPLENAVGGAVDIRHASGTQLVAEFVAVAEDCRFTHRRSTSTRTEPAGAGAGWGDLRRRTGLRGVRGCGRRIRRLVAVAVVVGLV